MISVATRAASTAATNFVNFVPRIGAYASLDNVQSLRNLSTSSITNPTYVAVEGLDKSIGKSLSDANILTLNSIVKDGRGGKDALLQLAQSSSN